MALMLHPLLRQVGLEVPAELPNGELTGLSCDSRRVGAGTLFVGLPGTQVDGGRFWPQALQELGQMVGSGKLRPRETMAQGLAAAPEAFLGLLKGRNFGKQLVKLV